MSHRKSLRPLALAAAPALLACMFVLACDRSPDRAERPNMTAPTRVATSEAIRRLHASNDYDWVGVAHNRALDDFRAELRKPGILTRNICAFIEDFVAYPQRFAPNGHSI